MTRTARLGWFASAIGGVLLAMPTLGSAATVAADVSVVLPEPDPPETPAPSDLTALASAAKVTAALAPGLDPTKPANRKLGSHVVVAVSPLAGGAQLFGQSVGPVRPASTMKLLTTTAALATLGPDHTFTTSVVLEAAKTASAVGKRRAPTVVLVGGGDPLLASRPPGPEAYPQRADVRTLAKATAASLLAQGVRRVRLGYDDHIFAGPRGSAQWRTDYLSADIVAPITGLWIDEGRPASGFGRVADPSLAAAEALKSALARAGVEVVGSPQTVIAGSAATELASVESPPLSQILEHTLAVSDNEAAEVLAHHVGIESAQDGSFAGGARGVATVLGSLGVPLAGVSIFDGSGLSRADRLTPAALLGVLQLAASPSHPELRAVLTGLPVAGFTGSLENRFADGPPAARGLIRAKTGTLTGVHGLAGVALDQDGLAYAFVMIADRVKLENQLAARLGIDRLAASLAACHCAQQ